MPPDEFYRNVNNSVYTNAVAKFRLEFLRRFSLSIYQQISDGSIWFPSSLQFAEDLAKLLHHPAPQQWREVAEGLKIPFDPAARYHPEYDGYLKGESFLPD